MDFAKVDNGTDEIFYVGHSEFKLMNLTLDRLDTYYGGGMTPFVELVVNMTLGRKSQFFYYMYMLPADLILFMLPVIHLLPANRDSKIFMCKLISYLNVALLYLTPALSPQIFHFKI